MLITRAVAQAEPFARAVREAGGLPVLLPGIQIEPVAVSRIVSDADWVIFISPNAVQYGLELVRPLLARGARAAAIGPSTARALDASGVNQPLRPDDGFDSESLLRLSVFQRLHGQRVVMCVGSD